MNAHIASLTAHATARQPAARKGISSSWQPTALPRRGKNERPFEENRKKMNSQQIAELTTKAVDELAGALEAGHSEALTQYLTAIGRFHKYSLHNVMLIVLQKPAATHVAGFHTWHKLGRHVRKGEKGITIFAPMVRRKREPESETPESSEKTVVGYSMTN
jgi:N-terminal domain of anti-restriction factor ArdC